MTGLAANVVWASLAGIAISLFVGALVAAVVRVARPAAATRCALWFVVLIVAGLGPPVIVVTMTVQSAAHATAGCAGESRVSRWVRPPVLRLERTLRGDAPSAGDALPHPRLRSLRAVLDALRRPPALPQTAALALIAVWVAGASAGLIGIAASVARLRRLKARSSPLEGDLADDLPWLTETPGREIYLRLSHEIEMPIAVGFKRPVILIPADMTGPRGLVAIESLVMHEYAHLARYDDWANLAQRVVERIVWFNPLVWYAGRRIALEREVAADDAVVARTRAPRDYAAALWRLAREMRMHPHHVVAPGAMFTRKQVSIRIERLLDDSSRRRPQIGTGFFVAVIGACTVAAVAASAPPLPLAPVSSQRAFAPAVTVAIVTPSPEPAATLMPIAPAAPAPPPATPAPAETSTPASTPSVAKAGIRDCEGCDLAHADLHGQRLAGGRFDGANLSGADLRGADLRGTQLDGVDLASANLDHADLRGAHLVGADLSAASMRGTLMANTELTGATLP